MTSGAPKIKLKQTHGHFHAAAGIWQGSGIVQVACFPLPAASCATCRFTVRGHARRTPVHPALAFAPTIRLRDVALGRLRLGQV